MLQYLAHKNKKLFPASLWSCMVCLLDLSFFLRFLSLFLCILLRISFYFLFLLKSHNTLLSFLSLTHTLGIVPLLLNPCSYFFIHIVHFPSQLHLRNLPLSLSLFFLFSSGQLIVILCRHKFQTNKWIKTPTKRIALFLTHQNSYAFYQKKYSTIPNCFVLLPRRKV